MSAAAGGQRPGRGADRRQRPRHSATLPPARYSVASSGWGLELEREKPGTGLGLYIVRNWSAGLRAKIRVRDREHGPGTVFEVQLPGETT